jgi:hypothetical protein
MSGIKPRHSLDGDAPLQKPLLPREQDPGVGEAGLGKGIGVEVGFSVGKGGVLESGVGCAEANDPGQVLRHVVGLRRRPEPGGEGDAVPGAELEHEGGQPQLHPEVGYLGLAVEPLPDKGPLKQTIPKK